MNSCATVSPAKKAALNGLSIALVFLELCIRDRM